MSIVGRDDEGGIGSNPDAMERPWWQVAVVAMVVALAFCWPRSWALDHVWGDPLGEADNHLWMFWSATHFESEILANAPDGIRIPLMDPINWFSFWLGHTLHGPVLGWRFMMFFNLGVALLGGYGLARELAGPRVAWVGMVGTATAPSLAGFMDFGMTESWTIGWLAVHAWMLVSLARRGGWGRALAAGLSLGAIAMSGWYHALYGLILESLLVPILFWHYRRPSVVWQGLIGLAVALPIWMRFQPYRGLWEGRWRPPDSEPPAGIREAWMDGLGWRELPIYGTDMMNFFLPTVDSIRPAKCAYLGSVLLALALWGLLKERRKAGPLLLLALPFLLLALGPWPTVGGEALGLAGPAYWLVRVFEDLRGLSHWERSVGAAVPFLAAAAAVGARSLPRQKFWIPLVCVFVLVDSIAFSNARWPRATYSAVAPPSFSDIPGEGGLVQVPFDNYRTMHSTEPARLYTRWQLGHRRAVSENYEGVDALIRESTLVQVVDGLCENLESEDWEHAALDPQRIPPYYKIPFNRRARHAPEGSELESERADMRAWGYQWIVLHLDRCTREGRVVELLESRLGDGTRVDSGTMIWEL